jgi:hypothetical protein
LEKFEFPALDSWEGRPEAAVRKAQLGNSKKRHSSKPKMAKSMFLIVGLMRGTTGERLRLGARTIPLL